MNSEHNYCPLVTKCLMFKNGKCNKLKNFRNCGNYNEFEAEKSGVKLDDIANYVIDQLKKAKKIENESIDKSEKCPYRLNCYLVFKKACDNFYDECDGWCEDCEFNIPDYGVYCESVEYEKCESYEIISILKVDYEALGVHSTEDLKKFYGEEHYERLGGYIKCAFLKPEDFKDSQKSLDDYL